MSPGYPLFLAAIYGASGHATDGRPRYLLDAIQILIACSTIVAIFLIGKQLFNDEVGLIAALLMAAYPPAMVATNLWLTETLATAILVWYIYVTLRAYDRDGVRLWVLSGALLGLAVLIRPAFLPIAVAPFAIRFLWGRREHVFKLAAVSALAFALTLMPWMIRNMIVVHEPAPFSTHGGDPILAGVDSYYYEAGAPYAFHGPTYEQYMASDSKLSKDEVAQATIIQGLKTRPLQTVWWFTLGKFVRMYTAGWLGDTRYLGTVTLIVRQMIVVLGWVGCAYAFKERRLRVLALMVFIGTAVLVSVSAEPRYVFSWIAVLTVPAAFVLRRLWTAPEAAFQAIPSSSVRSLPPTR